MIVLVTGATGLVGKKVVDLLIKNKHTVHYLSTSKSKIKNKLFCKGFFWNTDTNEIDKNAFDDVEVIIHLAGASIAKRWTNNYKKEILNSRVNSSNLLFNFLKNNKHQVKRIISASAIGIYPSSETTIYNEENHTFDTSFLCEVTQKWEKSVDQFQMININVTKLRIGVVLSNEGGALLEMIKPIKLGIGSAIGSGKQYVSWIHISDLANIFLHVFNNNLLGTYNAVAPYSITNNELNKQIANTLDKPYFFPKFPKIAIELLLGEMHHLLTDSQNISSKKIINSGFQFQFESVNKALANLLK